MTIDNLFSGNEICYTDPHTGQRVCVRAQVNPENSLIQFEGPREIIEKIHLQIAENLKKEEE